MDSLLDPDSQLCPHRFSLKAESQDRHRLSLNFGYPAPIPKQEGDA